MIEKQNHEKIVKTKQCGDIHIYYNYLNNSKIQVSLTVCLECDRLRMTDLKSHQVILLGCKESCTKLFGVGGVIYMINQIINKDIKKFENQKIFDLTNQI